MTVQSERNTVDSLMRPLFLPDAPGAAVMIINGGKVLIEQGYGLADVGEHRVITPVTNFRMASVSKQFTALAVMQLAEAAKMSPEDPLEKYFSRLPAAMRVITARQLLTHTSGIPDYEPLIPAGREEQLHDEDVLHLIERENKLYFSPGTAFRYSNTGYCLLAQIVEQVSGSSFSRYMQENIFRPPGMKAAQMYEKNGKIAHRAYGYHKRDGSWHFADQSLTSATLGDGGVYTSLQDYRRWTRALLCHELVSEQSMQEVFRPQAGVKDGVSYGYGWFIGREEDGTVCYFHSGESTGFHHIVYANPEKKLWIVLFTNRDDDVIAQAFDQIAGIMGVKLNLSSKDQSLFHWLSGVYGD